MSFLSNAKAAGSIVAIVLALGGVVGMVWGGATHNQQLFNAGGICMAGLGLFGFGYGFILLSDKE